jgi:hypothetical protein
MCMVRELFESRKRVELILDFVYSVNSFVLFLRGTP